jgi:hypothetical protein
MVRKTRILKNPRARRENLIVKELRDETLVYDGQGGRAICLNGLAAEVWRRCDGSTPPSEIARAMSTAETAGVEERAVWLALDQLNRAKLLDGFTITPSIRDAASRRQLLRGIGVGAAAVVPLVTSIALPTVADAQSCFPDGFGCVINEQCCSFNCNGGSCGPQLGLPRALR